MSIEIIQGDCRKEMVSLIEKNVLVDAILTDPPYHLTASKNSSKGFMNKAWDGGNISFDPEVWKLCLKLLKPGGHLLSFGGSRTYHRMAVAIEDSGFEIRDQIMWIYGSGFPKGVNISKEIDKKLGAEREVLATRKAHDFTSGGYVKDIRNSKLTTTKSFDYQYTAPATDQAKKWDGWGTALKPAHEPICLARKPISENTIADNILQNTTGGINIDDCRFGDPGVRFSKPPTPKGRFPANVIHDGSEIIEQEFRWGYGDSGTASQFFYCAKPSPNERMGLKHPTIKPLALMRYLCRLIVPKNGIVLDPFSGTGTTGIAALHEGFSTVLIEREQEYIEDIKQRVSDFHPRLPFT